MMKPMKIQSLMLNPNIIPLYAEIAAKASCASA